MTVGSAESDVAQELTSYDETPYANHPYSFTHPDRLATIATLFGLKPQPVKKCRVLEIGCSSGENIIPMACTLPDSEFVGIDLSSRQIDEGHKRIESMGLKNVELKRLNILEVDKSLGSFDYIIAHGIFSWVNTEVQEKMFDICRELLSPNGIAYISYNTFPGWHFRGMIRDMMMYHTSALKLPTERAQQARALLDFLSQSVSTDNNAYGILLKGEADLLRQHPDAYLIHDHLEEHNEPIYFHQFAQRANSHGLNFLGEADFSVMLAGNLTKLVATTLSQISNDIIKTEQYMDFVRNRYFRQTLLCRQEVAINRNLGPMSIVPFYIACPAKPVPETPGTEAQTFQEASGRTFNVSGLFLKSAFHHLADIWPQSVKFEDLVNIARAKSQTMDPGEPDALATSILTLFASSYCTLRIEPAPFVVEISERPMASKLAREQAKTKDMVTNQLHDLCTTDAFSRQLLLLLDGTRDRQQLLEELTQLVQKGTLVIYKEGKMLKDSEPIKEVLTPKINDLLTLFAKAAFLVS